MITRFLLICDSNFSVPPVGAKVTNKVTAEERKELLSRNPVNVHNSSVDNSGGSGIISGRRSEKNHTFLKIILMKKLARLISVIGKQLLVRYRNLNISILTVILNSVGNDLKFYPERVPIGDEQHERIKRACKELGIRYSRVSR